MNKTILMASVLLALVGCVGCVGGEGREGEGELDYETDSVQPGGACLVDSDCDGDFDVDCEGGFCLPHFPTPRRCIDATHAWRAARDELSDSSDVDCAIWGGVCEDYRGCVLPDDVPGSVLHSRAFPVPITLPQTLELSAGSCVAIEVPERTGVIVTDDPSSSSLPDDAFPTPWHFRWFQGDNERLWGDVGGVQAEAGPLVACAELFWSGGTVTFMTVPLDDERLGDVCLDVQHLRIDGETQPCPANTVCSTQLGEPGCRGGEGETCSFNCVGSCLDDGITNLCTAERVRREDTGLCDGNIYASHTDSRMTCSERCEDLLGCVVSPGEPCFRFEWCIDPITLDDVTTCPDTSVCPAVAQ